MGLLTAPTGRLIGSRRIGTRTPVNRNPRPSLPVLAPAVRSPACCIYATSLGVYALRLNGQTVGDAVLTPGWTTYQHRIQYQTYDVTALLHDGENVLGALLGDGWYRGHLGFQRQRNFYGDRLALLLQLHITYADGRTEMISSDEQWRATNTGPTFAWPILIGRDGIPPADYAKWMMLTADDLRQLAAERHIQVEGDNVARVTATPHFAPADHVELAHAGSAKKTARTGWRQLALPYMAKVWRSGMFASMKEFFRTLEEKSGEPDSPFDKRHGELVLRGTGKPLSLENCGELPARNH